MSDELHEVSPSAGHLHWAVCSAGPRLGVYRPWPTCKVDREVREGQRPSLNCLQCRAEADVSPPNARKVDKEVREGPLSLNYARLASVEFVQLSDKLREMSPSPYLPAFLMTKICKALSWKKCCKAASPSGIIAEMLKPAGGDGVELARQLGEAVFQQRWDPSGLGWEPYPEPL